MSYRVFDILKNRDEVKDWLNTNIVRENDLFVVSPYFTKGGLGLIRGYPPGRLFVRGLVGDVENGSLCLESLKILITLGWEIRCNSKVHMKILYSSRTESCVLGSANLTTNGVSNDLRGNLELMCSVSNFDNSRIFDFYESSEVIKLEQLEKIQFDKVGSFVSIMSSTGFSLLDIPQSKSLEVLYQKIKRGLSEEVVLHDMKLMGIKYNDSFEVIKTKFLELNIVINLLRFVDEGKKFGLIKSWLKKNVIDVPTPSNEDYVSQLRKLYSLIVESSKDYEIKVLQKHSQWLLKVKIGNDV